MSYNYGPISATAKKLIDKFGRSIKRRTSTNTGTDFDPVITNVDTDMIGAFTSFKNSEIDGTLIKATDMKILTYSEVSTEDKIVDGSIVYSVVNVDVVQPGATKILYKVQVRV